MSDLFFNSYTFSDMCCKHKLNDNVCRNIDRNNFEYIDSIAREIQRIIPF